MHQGFSNTKMITKRHTTPPLRRLTDPLKKDLIPLGQPFRPNFRDGTKGDYGFTAGKQATLHRKITHMHQGFSNTKMITKRHTTPPLRRLTDPLKKDLIPLGQPFRPNFRDGTKGDYGFTAGKQATLHRKITHMHQGFSNTKMITKRHTTPPLRRLTDPLKKDLIPLGQPFRPNFRDGTKGDYGFTAGKQATLHRKITHMHQGFSNTKMITKRHTTPPLRRLTDPLKKDLIPLGQPFRPNFRDGTKGDYGFTAGKQATLHRKITHMHQGFSNTKMITKRHTTPPLRRLTDSLKKDLIPLGQPFRPNFRDGTKGDYGFTAGKQATLHSKHTDAPHLNTKMIQKGTQHPPSDTNRPTKKDLIRLGNQENQTKWKKALWIRRENRRHSLKTHRCTTFKYKNDPKRHTTPPLRH